MTKSSNRLFLILLLFCAACSSKSESKPAASIPPQTSTAPKLGVEQKRISEDLPKKALLLMIDNAPLIGAVVKVEDKSVKEGLAHNFIHKIKPRVGGGESHIWVYKEAPDRSWFMVENTFNERVYKVSFQIGNPNQAGSYLVDIENGAVERQLDSFSSALGQ